MSRRRFLVPETVQTLATDCGPAVLKSLLEGYGVPARYDRLREVCATDIDGTSFDVLDSLLGRFGFLTEKSLTPPEDLFGPGADQGPAIVVTRLPNGFAHFVLVWRQLGDRLLVMDPGQGRRWVKASDFARELLVHKMFVSAEYWRAWACARPSFRNVLAQRLRRAKLSGAASLLELVRADTEPRTLSALDAAARLVDVLRERGAVRAGHRAEALLRTLFDAAAPVPSRDVRYIPAMYWSASPLWDDRTTMLLRGVPVIRVLGLRSSARAGATVQASRSDAGVEHALGRAPGAFSELWGVLTPRLKGLFVGLMPLAVLSAVCEVLTVLSVRQLLSTERYLTLAGQRIGALVALGVLCAMAFGLDAVVSRGTLLLGRQLELRFRVKFMRHSSQLPDAYFRTRSGADLADRCHDLAALRSVPDLGLRALSALVGFAGVLAGLCWLAPEQRGLTLALGACALGLPLLAQQPLAALDMRARTHAGALMRFYLDALLGAVPIRTHHASSAVRQEHERLLVHWVRALSAGARHAVTAELCVALLGVVLTALLLFPLIREGAPRASMLLIAYWALALPAQGNELSLLLRQGFALRNQAARLLEPLGVEVESFGAGDASSPVAEVGGVAAGPVAVAFRGVSVKTSEQHALLRDVDFEIPRGQKLAIVGASGAGKSSLLAVLLGYHRPSEGQVFIDGRPLDPSTLAALRRNLAWVDPGVRIWNRSLFDNIAYGHASSSDSALHDLVTATELTEVLERMAGDDRAPVGEGGAFLSGGEGQRLRLARALHRRSAGLVLLDEPFRGLDRERRARLLSLALRYWSRATIVCVTHDIRETRAFERVLVVDRGRIVEDGAPSELASTDGTYRRLLEREREVEAALWRSGAWRRRALDAGRLREPAP